MATHTVSLFSFCLVLSERDDETNSQRTSASLISRGQLLIYMLSSPCEDFFRRLSAETTVQRLVWNVISAFDGRDARSLFRTLARTDFFSSDLKKRNRIVALLFVRNCCFCSPQNVLVRCSHGCHTLRFGLQSNVGVTLKCLVIYSFNFFLRSLTIVAVIIVAPWLENEHA
mgnify:CR=1 FL=1